jgi:hypothetical protein
VELPAALGPRHRACQPMRAGNFLHFPERPSGIVAMVETKIFLSLPKKSVKNVTWSSKKVFNSKYQQKVCEQMHGARVLYLQHANEKRNNFFYILQRDREKFCFILEFSMKNRITWQNMNEIGLWFNIGFICESGFKFATIAMTLGTPGIYLLQQDHGRTLKEAPEIRNPSAIPADVSD